MVVCHLYAVLPSHAHVNKPILIFDTDEARLFSIDVSHNLQFNFLFIVNFQLRETSYLKKPCSLPFRVSRNPVKDILHKFYNFNIQ